MKPGDWPQLGNVHANGDRFVGRDTFPVPVASRMFQRSVTGIVSGIEIDDELAVRFDGKYWQVSTDGETLGRLTWSLADEVYRDWQEEQVVHPREGILTVTRLLLNASGEVINCGGIVTPE